MCRLEKLKKGGEKRGRGALFRKKKTGKKGGRVKRGADRRRRFRGRGEVAGDWRRGWAASAGERVPRETSKVCDRLWVCNQLMLLPPPLPMGPRVLRCAGRTCGLQS